MRKIWEVLGMMVLMLAFGMMQGNAIAYEDERYPGLEVHTYEDFQYVDHGDSLEIIGYTGYQATVRIPARIGYKSVTHIGYQAFMGKGNMYDVVIPEGIQLIEEDAFRDTGLGRVSIPGTVRAIGAHAFYSEKMQNISVSTANKHYQSKNGVLFDASGKSLVCYPIGNPRKTYIVPDEVTSIQTYAFEGAKKLESIIFTSKSQLQIIREHAFRNLDIKDIALPQGLKEIQDCAFDQNKKLEAVYFMGDAPEISIGTYASFRGCGPLKFYYRNNKSGWTSPTWNGFSAQPYSVKESDRETLTYLAMAKLCTDNFSDLEKYVGRMVADMVQDGYALSKPIFNDATYGCREACIGARYHLTYDDLFMLVLKDWKIVKQMRADNIGFGATLFENTKTRDWVLAYRNSGDITDKMNFIKDWCLNDFVLYFSDEVGNQMPRAIKEYDEIKKKATSERRNLSVTGQSLGGGLSLGVSVSRDVKAITFNSVPMFSNVFARYPDYINGMSFEGIDKMKHVDHISSRDYLAGLWDTEYYEESIEEISWLIEGFLKIANHGAVQLKNVANFFSDGPKERYKSLKYKYDYQKNFVAHWDYIVHDVSSVFNFGQCHDFCSMFSITNGEFHMNQMTRQFQYGPTDKAVFGRDQSINGMYTIAGGSGDQIIICFSPNRQEQIFGGLGKDRISSLGENDVIIGGKGDDWISGGAGIDRYTYTKGDGFDTIVDIEGNINIQLMNFSSNDQIEFKPNDHVVDGKQYHSILCNGSAIIEICTDHIGENDPSKNSKKIAIRKANGETIEVKQTSTHEGTRYIFTCPVTVQVLDGNGKTVAELKSGKEQAFINDYGHFYVFEEEEGGYGKVIELFEGNTIQAVGEGTGTFDLIVEEMGSDQPKRLGAKNMPVQKGSLITLVGDLSSGIKVQVDLDGDGKIDYIRELTASLEGISDMNLPQTGDSSMLLVWISFCVAAMTALMMIGKMKKKA